MAERRKHQRYSINQKCLVRHAANVGILMDLSLGGLSCQCVNFEERSPSPCWEIDLLCLGNSTWVKALNLEVVSSEESPGEFMASLNIRKCRARFAPLREEQTELLDDLIHACSYTPKQKNQRDQP